ncbi:heterokaryon incompatibility protein-domain-containing protein [Diaporthe sp. PMI_573]|nr:heterokaryon incompatibility protein-domain-containing protein [Diaporthaceae sp. PMI_573]
MYVHGLLALDEIRICELAPGKFSDDIAITLRAEKFDLRKPPVYEALSYAWGSTIFTSSVHDTGVADGDGDIPITHNLEIALRHVRHPDKTRTLWVDSLCIDQSNNKEKGCQVNKMGEIYRLAERVIVWLGAEAHDSNRVLDLFEEMGSQVDFHPKTLSITPSSQARDASLGDMAINLPYGEEDLTFIYHMLCRPWFERLWVRQEILQANSAAMAVCGFHVLAWPKFQRALACLYLKRRNYFLYENELAVRLDMVRTLLFGSAGVSLSTIRRDFGMLQCANPRDRVYAVLAIIRQHLKGLDVPADYDKTVFEVYEDFVTRYMGHSHDISFLAACQLKDDVSEIPSWVPDWSNRVKTRVETRIWSANAMFASGHLAAPLSDVGKGKLETVGVMIGELRRLRKIPLGVAGTDKSLADLLRDIIPKKSLDSDYVAGGTTLEAYVQATCFEAFADNFSPPLEHLPTLSASIEVTRQILSSEVSSKLLEAIKDETSLFLSRMYMTLGGRTLYEVESGYIGVGPTQIRAGDLLCVVLGSSLPMFLRRVDDRVNQYRLVGTCYARGISQCEAFLGPLPEGTKMIQTLQQGAASQWRRTFVDGNGKSSMMDPRLISWPIEKEDYRRKVERGEENFLEVEPELLKKNGIKVESFILV